MTKKSKDCDVLLVSTLDDICWLLNLRGTDIDYNPVFFSFVCFWPKTKTATLYVNPSKVESVSDYLASIDVKVQPYEKVTEDLTSFIAEGFKVGFDKNKANSSLFKIVESNFFETDDLIAEIKMVKNETESTGMRNANIRDCAAIMKYFAWLEQELAKPDHGITEFTGARKVESFRAESELFRGPSFDSISSIGSNGAVIHYKPEEDTCKTINNKEIYLLDSGGQYLDGTTDITRCGHFSGCEPKPFEKEAYTRVLLGTLEVERIIWPKSCPLTGMMIEVLGRRNLWAAGLDFAHSIGHGVGTFLNVHEGPNGISRVNKTVIEAGMCVSDEPGYYKDGEFGIRIENVIICQKHPEFPDYLMWENMTVAPYCRELIDVNLLPAEMRVYLDTFHQKCLSLLTPFLEKDPLALAYVTRQCQPL